MKETVRRWAKQGWAMAKKVLPPKVAEAIRVPTKKALRKVGLVSQPRSRPSSS
jgi:hypothetical protein